MLATFSLALWAAAAPPAVVLPPEVEAHYRDLNFVNAFSTRRERTLVRDLRRRGDDPRLTRVAEAIARVESAIEDVDRKMVMTVGRQPEIALRSALFRILSFTIDEAKGEATAQVETLMLEPPVQGTLLARFPELTRDGKIPGLDGILGTIGPPPTRTREMHRWRRTAGGATRPRSCS